jgi:hypothetical protein
MIRVPLSNSDSEVYISDIDADVLVFTWYLKQSDHKWYVCTGIRQGHVIKTLRLHRLIAARAGLPVHYGVDVHHIDGSRFNNCRENLKAIDHADHAIVHGSSKW